MLLLPVGLIGAPGGCFVTPPLAAHILTCFESIKISLILTIVLKLIIQKNFDS